MSAFTPGPWHTGPHYKSDVESREGRICECRPMHAPTAIANARLIAAAPELLDALKNICAAYSSSAYSPNLGQRNAQEQAAKAIAKAEGGQS